MVHRPHEMLVENERHPARLPEAAIGEADAVGLDELCWCGLVGVSHVLARMRHFWAGMNHHDLSSNYSSRIASGTSARAAFAQSTSCCFSGGSLVAALMQGVTVGALVEGLPLAGIRYTGDLVATIDCRDQASAI